MVFGNQGNYENQAAAIKAIAPKIGCGRDTLRRWDQQEETDTGRRDGVTSEERARIKEPEREVRERWPAAALRAQDASLSCLSRAFPFRCVGFGAPVAGKATRQGPARRRRA